MAQVGEYKMPEIKQKWHTFRAGRISQNVDCWKRITSDRLLLSHVQAHRSEFVELPHQTWPARPIRFEEQEKEFLRVELQDLLEKGVLRIVEHEPGEFVSNVFLRPKKEAGKYRMILNLKQLNEFVEYHHFKMDTLETVLKLIQPDVFMASIDFTDAYYS
jgi:hypothetical protein